MVLTLEGCSDDSKTEKPEHAGRSIRLCENQRFKYISPPSTKLPRAPECLFNHRRPATQKKQSLWFREHMLRS